MAPAEHARLFAKLKLDTSSPRLISNSPLTRHISQESAIVDEDVEDEAFGTQKPVQPPISIADRSPLLAPDALASERYALHDVQEGVAQTYHDVEHSEPRNIPGKPARLSSGDSDNGSRSGSRRSSVSFASDVFLEDGKTLSLGEPVPKPAGKSRTRGRSLLDEIAKTENKHRAVSESRRDEYDPRTGQRLGYEIRDPHGYHQGIMRHPLLQSTVDDLARRPAITDERVASLISDRTASPLPDEVQTPSDYGAISPQPMQETPSPLGFTSSSLPFSRRTSQRSKSYRDVMRSDGGRRPGRRSSARSANSPAGAFLSMWARDDSASKAALDDEGQEIDTSGYIIGRQIGVGGFSVVKEVFNIENGVRKRQAVKIVRKQVSGKGEDENEKVQAEFEHEVSVWRYLKHPYILPLMKCFETPFATFCITKLNEGGTLFDLIHARRKAGAGGLPSDLAKRYVYQMASAIRYLHEDVHVVHRDIKIENVLIDMSNPDAARDGGNVLICDFGMADFVYNENRGDPEPFDQDMHIGPSHTSTSVTGSLRYAAPELLESPHQLYSTEVDMWAFGNVVYAMLTAQLAFSDSFEPRVVMQILNGEWNEAPLYKANAVKGLTDAPVDMVKGLLQKDPEERWTIADVLRSPWLEGCAELYEPDEERWVDDD